VQSLPRLLFPKKPSFGIGYVLDMYWICIGYVLDLFVFEGPIQGNDSDLEGLDLGTESWGDS
jgi:hypothetical protein